jgi:hypothetical protein
MPLRNGFVLDLSLIRTTIVARPRTKVSPTIVQLHRLRGSAVIASAQALMELFAVEGAIYGRSNTIGT